MIPNRKITSAALAGALWVLLAWLTGTFGLSLSDELLSALTTLIVAGTGYLVPLPRDEVTPEAVARGHASPQ